MCVTELVWWMISYRWKCCEVGYPSRGFAPNERVRLVDLSGCCLLESNGKMLHRVLVDGYRGAPLYHPQIYLHQTFEQNRMKVCPTLQTACCSYINAKMFLPACTSLPIVLDCWPSGAVRINPANGRSSVMHAQ